MTFARLNFFLIFLTGVSGHHRQADNLFHSDDLYAHYEIFEKEIRPCSTDQLNAKKMSPDLSLSIAAAWEVILRKHETVHDSIDVGWFIGFLEGRLAVDIPIFWKTLFKKITVGERRFTSIKFGDFDRGLRETRFVFSCPEKMLVAEAGDKYEIQQNGTQVRLPKAVARHYPLVTLTNIASRSGWKVVAVYEQGQNTYKIYATNDDRISWSSTGVAGGNPVLGSGPGRIHYAEVAIVDDRVFVFGITSESAHINAFHLSSGNPIFRFSTSWHCVRGE